MLTIQAMGITLCVFLLYWFTLAPTVLWGDDAELQRLAFTGESGSGLRNYPLWQLAARQITRLPLGDIAKGANLTSAIFAALTIGVLFIAIKMLTDSQPAAWIGGLALGVSHTFWLHAVRAEVYTLFLFLLTAVITLLIWWRRKMSDWILAAAFFLAGIALLAHPLILTAVPAMVVFVVSVKRNALRSYTLAAAALLLGIVPYLVINTSATQSGFNVQAVAAGLWQVQVRDMMLWAGFLGYQFLILLPIGILGFIQFGRTDRIYALFLALLFLGNVIFALSHRVPDQYVFYLPSYVVFALWVGMGAALIFDKGLLLIKQRLVLFALLLLAAGLPVLFYALTPRILNQFGVTLLAARDLPGRDNNLFFLYPPKNGYYGARDYGETVLRVLPPDAAVLADWLPLQTLLYLQQVEGLRPDVLLVEAHVGRGEQLPWLIEQSRTRPVFIADNERYYDMEEINQLFEVSSFGPIYKLLRKE